jgi:acyl-CoA thioesterase-1
MSCLYLDYFDANFRCAQRTGRTMLLLLFIGLLPIDGSQAGVTSRSVLVLGDSISAAYGMSLDQGWVALLAGRLAETHPEWQVVNASISGETSAGAAARLPALLAEHKPAVVVIELGGNDGLRGYPVKRLRNNLRSMVEQSRASGAQVLLLAMEIPPNYGSRYTQAFRSSFATVAEETGSALSPFMLDGVATDQSLMQNDGIHPSVEAQPLLLANVWPHLEPLLANPPPTRTTSQE